MFHLPHNWLIGLLIILVVPVWKLLKPLVSPMMQRRKQYISLLGNTKRTLESLQSDIKTFIDSSSQALEEIRKLKLEISVLRQELSDLKS